MLLDSFYSNKNFTYGELKFLNLPQASATRKDVNVPAPDSKRVNN